MEGRLPTNRPCCGTLVACRGADTPGEFCDIAIAIYAYRVAGLSILLVFCMAARLRAGDVAHPEISEVILFHQIPREEKKEEMRSVIAIRKYGGGGSG